MGRKITAEGNYNPNPDPKPNLKPIPTLRWIELLLFWLMMHHPFFPFVGGNIQNIEHVKYCLSAIKDFISWPL